MSARRWRPCWSSIWALWARSDLKAMAREIDERKKKKALRRLERARRALMEAEASGDAEGAAEIRAALSDWEAEFLASVEDRLETFGSAFADPEKGDLDSPLSRLQEAKLRELEKKAKGEETRPWMKRSSFKTKDGAKSGSSFRRKTPARASGRDINDDLAPPPGPAPEKTPPRVFRASELDTPAEDPPAAPEAQRARFTVIKGGKGED